MPSLDDRLTYTDISLKWNAIQMFRKERVRRLSWQVKKKTWYRTVCEICFLEYI